MKTRHYKTISGLFRALSNGTQRPQFTMHDYLSGRAIIGGRWQSFTLSDELADKVRGMFAGAIWSRGADEKAWRIDRAENCGIFRRVMIEKRKGVYYASYCAGQDYTAEVRFIQRLCR